MNWYIAKVIFRIASGSVGHTAQFDEHLRLIEATSFEEALLKARRLGITEEHQFINDRQQPVKWEFVNVEELIPLQGLKDGAEVYSQIQEREEAKAYIHAVHRKAAALQLNQH
jgi:hypothetical protein